MIDAIKIQAQNAKKMASIGHSLASTLVVTPVTILLQGDLGAGKTTFVQGLAKGLGVSEQITSPTYALEQRYRTKNGIPFTHIDLYRLQGKNVHEHLEHSHNHGGIRCIEWSERMENKVIDDPIIHIAIQEEGSGRIVSLSFEDANLPSDETMMAWQQDVHLPPHVGDHCRAVGTLCTQLAERLIEQGHVVRKGALQKAGMLHDLLRFLDFRPGASPAEYQPDTATLARWEELVKKYSGMHHEEGVAAFLREHGYDLLATIIEPHGLRIPHPSRPMIEQQILYYADKRVIGDRVVSLDERFDDFVKRYGEGKESESSRKWRKEAKDIEKSLFPDGIPNMEM